MAAAVPVVVLAIPRQLVLMDGGLHLSSATAVRGLLAGRWPDLLAWRPVLAPNMLVEAVMAGLTGVLDPNVALRLVLMVTLVALTAAFLVLVRSLGAPGWTVVLLLPLLSNATVLAGFLGYVAALVPAVLAISLTLRTTERPRPVLLLVLLVLTWLTHLVPALVASLVVVAVSLVAHRGAVRPVLRAVGPALALIAVMTVVFAGGGGSDGLGGSAFFGGRRVLDLAQPLVSLSTHEYLPARVLAVVLYAATAILLALRWRSSERAVRPVDGLLVSAAALTVITVITPETVGSVAYVATRLSIWVPLLLAGWVAGQWPLVGAHSTRPAGTPGGTTHGRTTLAVTGVVAALVTIALPVLRIGPLDQLGDDLAEIRQVGAAAPRGTTIVQFTLDDGPADRLAPLIDQVGHVAADRDLLDLGNISGETSYYPWRFTPTARLEPLLASTQPDLERVPPRVTLDRAIDARYPLGAVLVVGRRDAAPDVLDDPDFLSAQSALQRSFHLAATGPTDEAELWVR